MSTPVITDSAEKEKAEGTVVEDLPVAQATALTFATAAGGRTLTMIDIPIETAGFQLSGYPVQLGEALDKNINLPDGAQPGMYVHSIQILPDLEVTHLVNTETAKTTAACQGPPSTSTLRYSLTLRYSKW